MLRYDSGNAAAIGYSQQKKINFDLGLIRNHYVGRTFIEPSQKIRSLGVKLKLNANKTTIKNKKVILSPHSATFTDECTSRMSIETTKNIIDFFENKIDKSMIVKI